MNKKQKSTMTKFKKFNTNKKPKFNPGLSQSVENKLRKKFIPIKNLNTKQWKGNQFPIPMQCPPKI